jgi:purine-binding chemotaxis protein CheW
MDILAARKKATEQAKARNKPEQEEAEQPTQQEGPPPSPEHAEQDIVPMATIAAPPPAGSVEAESGEPHDTTGTRPVPSVGAPGAIERRELEMLSFRLNNEEYAVLVADVREVLKIVQLTTVPNAPEYILGVMSLRGTILPVIELGKRLGLATGVKDEKSRIVVVSAGDEEAGLLVDRVTGVFRVLPDEIKPPPENIERGAEFLRGIVRKDNRLYILLDLKKALAV